MKKNEFGKYFKDLRLEKGITQAQIAVAIGKQKMLISNIEHGKNSAPKEKDLELISRELKLNVNEKDELFIMAALSKGKLPDELMQYIMANRKSLELIKFLQEHKFSDDRISLIYSYCKLMHKQTGGQ